MENIVKPVEGAAMNAATPQRGNTSSTTTTHTDTTETSTGSQGPGLELSRFDSPVPPDDIVAQRKNESRYRLNLQHDFHPSRELDIYHQMVAWLTISLVVLALWEPSPIELGAVGYLSRPSGSFVTLFNSFNPQQSSDGRAKGMPSLYGYGRQILQGSQRQDRRKLSQRGLDIIQGLLWFRSRGDVFQYVVSRSILRIFH